MPKNWLQFYFSFKGRATRYDFNMRYMFVAFVGAIVAYGLDYMMWGDAIFAKEPKTYIYNIWTLIVFLSGLAVACRRLHDMDYSGWWQMLAHSFAFGIGAIVVFTIGAAILLDPLSAGFGGIMAILAFAVFYCAYFFFLSFKRGTIGPNKYGDDPLLITTPQTIETLS